MIGDNCSVSHRPDHDMPTPAKILLWGCVLVLAAMAAAGIALHLQAHQRAEAALIARLARRGELLHPLLMSARNGTPPVATSTEIQELVALADTEWVESNGNIKCEFPKCGFNNAEGECSLFLIVEQRSQCDFAIVNAEIICPEW